MTDILLLKQTDILLFHNDIFFLQKKNLYLMGQKSARLPAPLLILRNTFPGCMLSIQTLTALKSFKKMLVFGMFLIIILSSSFWLFLPPGYLSYLYVIKTNSQLILQILLMHTLFLVFHNPVPNMILYYLINSDQNFSS